VIKAVRDFFDSNGFILADTPIFTPAACEGTTTLFEVDYFWDEKAYLTQSGQLYNEATAAAFGNRMRSARRFALRSRKRVATSRSFGWSRPEVAYATYEDMMQLGEDMILAVVQRVLTDRRKN
jgi:asparaginyl-tRNA synthetase